MGEVLSISCAVTSLPDVFAAGVDVLLCIAKEASPLQSKSVVRGRFGAGVPSWIVWVGVYAFFGFLARLLVLGDFWDSIASSRLLIDSNVWLRESRAFLAFLFLDLGGTAIRYV